MQHTAFAVMDVETTHGDPLQGRIIEMACVVHDGIRELDRWNTLVRPVDAEVPAFVQRLTGITPGMLVHAPRFDQVARSVLHAVEGRILVAHNIRYDLTALQRECERAGLAFLPDTLCTEQLSRRLLPHLAYYNLTSLCRYLGIAKGHQHRAAHDTQATLSLLLHLLEEHGLEQVMSAVVRQPREMRA
ncbi:MAG: 3'-5' exonuclease [Flavobacteriales bacterium]